MNSIIRKAYDTWAAQGRTEEQKWAVMNFLTGAGDLGIEQLVKVARAAGRADTITAVADAMQPVLERQLEESRDVLQAAEE